MASDEEKREYLPIRTETILNNESTRDDFADGEQPAVVPTDSSTDVEEPNLERTQTSKSARERRTFEPINTGDRAELHRIASSFGGSVALSRTETNQTSHSALERRDTLYGVNIGDPVLDPNSPEFEPYKWARM
jgi:ATP-binding cassette subfamily G (WHITE) protein 2 (PDR)